MLSVTHYTHCQTTLVAEYYSLSSDTPQVMGITGQSFSPSSQCLTSHILNQKEKEKKELLILTTALAAVPA